MTLPSYAVDGVEPSVVKLNVTKREPDFFRPWTKAAPSKVSGSGAVIDGKRILTNAHVVMFASQVLVQLRQGGDQYAGKVTAIAPGMDLALVELNDPSKLDPSPPLELAQELPQLKSHISVYGYPTGGDDLSVTDPGRQNRGTRVQQDRGGGQHRLSDSGRGNCGLSRGCERRPIRRQSDDV
jgi:S1-C subfamily serine protease